MPRPLNSYYEGYNHLRKLTDYSLEWKRANEGLYTNSLEVIRSIVEEDNYKTDLTKPFQKLLFHSRVPRNVIKYFLDHGASATRRHTEIYWPNIIPADEAASRKKWLLLKMILLHGGLVKKRLIETAPAADRRWFSDFITWREATKSFADDIKRQADMWNFMPPSYLGEIVIERQGYIDTRMHFEQMLWLCAECHKPLEGGKCKPCELSCPYCLVPMKGSSCNVCHYQDSPPWACAKCDRELENGKCRDCER